MTIPGQCALLLLRLGCYQYEHQATGFVSDTFITDTYSAQGAYIIGVEVVRILPGKQNNLQAYFLNSSEMAMS